MKESGSLAKSYLESRLQQTAFNSSHYVWALTDLEFFESSAGFLFAYQTSGQILFVALEPLPKTEGQAGMVKALAELRAKTGAQVTVFIGVYEPCMQLLAGAGFKGLRVGSDPWLNLEVGGPKGNKAKGIRSARNQALRAGVQIEEWAFDDVLASGERQAEIHAVKDRWSESSLFKLSGFLLSSEPLVRLEGRRLFVAKQSNRLVGFLITSPVRFGHSSYFEDLMFLPDAPNGCTEMLMLHAMETLRLDGQSEVSLGVVALNNFGFYDDAQESRAGHLWLNLTKRAAKLFYSSGGIELNRKRYQPKRWDDTFIAAHVEGGGSPSFFTWARILLTIVGLLQPRVSVTPAQAYHLTSRWLKHNASDLVWAAAFIALGLQAVHPTWMIVLAVVLGGTVLQLIQAHLRGRALWLTLGAGFVATELACMPAVMDLFNRGPVHLLSSHITLFPFWLVLFGAGVSFQYALKKRQKVIGPLVLLLIFAGFGQSAGRPEILAERAFPFLFLGLGYAAGWINFAIYRAQSQKRSKDPSPVKVTQRSA